MGCVLNSWEKTRQRDTDVVPREMVVPDLYEHDK